MDLGTVPIFPQGKWDCPLPKPCHCRAAVTVEASRGHDAAVVRRSSCATPREEDTPACRFCRADFTLHQRDLHPVCPLCFAPISDRARAAMLLAAQD